MLYLSAFIISLTVNIAVILISKKYNIFIDNIDTAKPQRCHVEATARVGGIGVFAGASLMFLEPLGQTMLISALPVILVGLFEDVTGLISPKKRLIIMILSALLAIYLLNSLITQIDYLRLPYPIAVIFTVFAIVGVTNSINIIDGLHGLASGTAFIAFLVFATVAYSTGDYELGNIALIILASLLGFFVLVFPFGKIFLGDGGAYFIGFILAIFSILLVDRSNVISVWYPLAVLIFPIWEVLFSIFRRSVFRKGNSFYADRLHLHSLLFRRTKLRNYAASGILIMINVGYQFLIMHFYNSSIALIGFILMFIILHNLCYCKIVRFEIFGKNAK